MPSRDEVLADPGFYDKPLDFQAKVLSAVDPAFTGLNSDQQNQALVAINGSRPGAKVAFAPTMSAQEIAQAKAMMSGGGSPTVQAARAANPIPQAPPPPPENQLRPRLNPFSEVWGGMRDIIEGVTAPKPVSPYEPRPGTPEAARMPPQPPQLTSGYNPYDTRMQQVGQGALRLLGGPFAPIFNLNSVGGEAVRDVTAKGIPGMGSKVPGTNFTPADALGHVAATALDWFAPQGVSKVLGAGAKAGSEYLGATAAETKAAELNAVRADARLAKEAARLEAERLSSQATREAQAGKEAIARDVGTQSRKLGQAQTGAQDRASQLFNEQKAQIETARQAELAKSGKSAPEAFQKEAFPTAPPPPPRQVEALPPEVAPTDQSPVRYGRDAKPKTAGPNLDDTTQMNSLAMQQLAKGKAAGGWDANDIQALSSPESGIAGVRTKNEDIFAQTHGDAIKRAAEKYPGENIPPENYLYRVKTPAGEGMLTLEQLNAIQDPKILEQQITHLKANDVTAENFAKVNPAKPPPVGPESPITGAGPEVGQAPAKGPRLADMLNGQGPMGQAEGQAVNKLEFGGKYKKEIFPREQAAAKKVYNERYNQARNAFGEDLFPVVNRQAAEDAVLKEADLTRQGVLPLVGERQAVASQRIEDSISRRAADIRDQMGGDGNDLVDMPRAYQEMKRLITDSVGGQRGSANLPAKVLAQILDPETKATQTFGKMVVDRQRVRLAQRAAADTGHNNAARQLGILEKGITADIEAATQATGRQDILDHLRETDLQYRTKYIPLYGNKASTRLTSRRFDEGVVDAIIRPAGAPGSVDAIERGFEVITKPAERQQLVGSWFKGGIESAMDANTGEWNRDKFLTWVNKYRNADTDDRVLKTVFGQNYDKFNELVSTMQRAQPKQIDTLAKETLASLKAARNTKANSAAEEFGGKIKTLESQGITQAKALDATAKQKISAAENGRTDAEKNLQKQIDDAVQKLVGKPRSKLSMMQRVGAYKTIGALAMLPTAIAVGTGSTQTILASAVAGGTILLTPMAWEKFVQSRKGLDLLIQGMRAVPGTADAMKWAAQTSAFARALQGGKQPQDQAQPPPAE